MASITKVTNEEKHGSLKWLKHELRQRGLYLGGRKADLEERLASNDEAFAETIWGAPAKMDTPPGAAETKAKKVSYYNR